MNTTDPLARIEALPVEWRHSHADAVSSELKNQTYAQNDWPEDEADAIALDLHLRHIAERLAESEAFVFKCVGLWDVRYKKKLVAEDCLTYAEAIISAAEEVSRG